MAVRRPRMRPRAIGLQGWLVGALLAVGIASSLAVLLVLLPTLETNIRQDRAKIESTRLANNLRDALFRQSDGLLEPLSPDALTRLAANLNDLTGADIRITYHPGPTQLMNGPLTRQYPLGGDATERLNDAARQTRWYSPDGRLIAPAIRVTLGPTGGALSIRAALPMPAVTPELAIVRRRVIVAIVLVLALAAIAGVLLARLIGSRLRRLAHTAATLSRGDLSVRSPQLGVVPEELVILQESLDGMAARLQSHVEAITDERDRDRAMIGSLMEGVLAVGADDTVSVANAAAGQLLELPDTAESARLDDLPPAIADAVRASRAPDASALKQLQVRTGAGRELEVHVARMRARDGDSTVVTLRDITEQLRLERARRDLVANVSHELKTPIAALKGFLELLEDERVGAPDRRAFLGAMTRETARMERLVEEQLQLARLDAGALPLERHDLDLGALVAAVVDARVPLAERDGLGLSVQAPPAPVTVIGDAARIEQVLVILLDNAVRHTPAGGRVRVAVGTEPAAARATITVADSGEGIPADDLPFIFDRFYRADTSREGHSAGLGLAIARGLVRAHHGAISVASRVGEGTTFTVSLPLADSRSITREEPIPPALAASTDSRSADRAPEGTVATTND